MLTFVKGAIGGWVGWWTSWVGGKGENLRPACFTDGLGFTVAL